MFLHAGYPYAEEKATHDYLITIHRKLTKVSLLDYIIKNYQKIYTEETLLSEILLTETIVN